MALEIKYVFPAVGEAKNARVREAFDDIVVYFEDVDISSTQIDVGALDIVTTGGVEASSFSGGFTASVNTPSQITSDQNNYALPSATVARLSTDASRTITGFVAGDTGQIAYIINVGSNDLVLANESGSSSAANRILTGLGANITLSQNHTVTILYDGTSSRWRIIGNNAGFWS